ncbi:hypothetical protein [Kitasatospora sp. GP82]|uniref:hypothetical protein n=1 Tax=Kitasatospora sp. GP82 TaxID=3035089 RepID=UPI002475D854|nr:hypothetical protein [Kitasatospora sp. GP82]MDH6123631.1 hypothetical protein [Kitasatospora sp. GP82]
MPPDLAEGRPPSNIGNVLAAGTGAGLKGHVGHMGQIGHSYVRAALIYRHAAAEQQTKISNGISAVVFDIRSRRRQPPVADTTSIAEVSRQG